VAWSVDRGGSIDAAGTFTATESGGPFVVTAAVGGISGTATVTGLELVDVALGKQASQSSFFAWAWVDPRVAIDGNTDGAFFDGSVTATAFEQHAWWQVDLGASCDLRQIRIWNRTDTVPERLSDYWVLLSDKPFASDDPVVAAQTPGVTAIFQHDQAGTPTILPVSCTARYVRVQLDGTNYLSLAEVEVMGVALPSAVGFLGPRGPSAMDDQPEVAVLPRRARLRAA
jgi:hypothetical protein